MPSPPDQTDAGRHVPLTVLPSPTPPERGRRLGHSRMGRRRAAVLIAVHLLILAHIIHWLATGRTLSPVEPSESMETIETGLVNAGAIFFLLAILSTLIFGRFFCGWGCHIVALQDLCGWLMKKCGVRPVPFRSRLLPLIPIILAFYMFLWPTLLKGVIEPALDTAWPAARAALGPLPGVPTEFRNELVQEDYWATFPTIAVAIPFLLICGFATVYFLGAKGFCTYGCPYGGIFSPVDRIAPGRIIVDHDKCEGCGHCTAVCTSNVRVHEEVRDYGAVVDPGCMKCLDCVSVCPKEALFLGFGAPAIA
ncbi:MAG: 4Fe-4S binding protein, partial [Phycisphaerales bacterium]|nr:4Fe-4S binding protein [Phycisphaerales bacterium]